ncbi:MAG: IS5 family transposase [Oscillospiraceae bacterium]|nr:IS5 family transposase [Oscillospiraceae bacterium]
MIKEYNDNQFRRITGVKRTTFEKMIEILKESYAEKHRRRGRNLKLSIEDQLLAALEYWREYRTYAHIAASYGIAESNMYRNIKWIEEVLIKDGTFSLPGKKELLKSDVEYEVILIDATETPVERPKKKQREYYSGKKKRHTLKTQLVVDKKTQKIICLSFCCGKKHDFRLFKESKVHAGENTQFETDTGYTGITAIHPNSLLPKKNRKNNPLSKEEKRNNRIISRKRIYVEHAIRFVKRFRILSERYRNRRKRFSLRFSLLAGICNFDMSI